MYKYNEFDEGFVRERVKQFRYQVKRRISGSLTEEEFKPLRLMNGLYLQLHAYMLRVAIPYGTINSMQMHKLADIADKWDKGYGHFTTRQNIQFNWPKLQDVPDILDALADVQMHAVQTSGNCIRNVTADHFAGAAADEIEDPRPIAELIREWSTDHPEFQFMPRKFKIAITGSNHDRAVIRAHDIGLETVKNENNEVGYRLFVGGGLGRTPMIGQILFEFVSKADLLPMLEAIVHVWNRIGRRDNKYKARIKILVHEYGLENLRIDVEREFERTRSAFGGYDQVILEAINRQFAEPEFIEKSSYKFEEALVKNGVFRSFVDTNVTQHKNPQYAILSISLKSIGATPGDASSEQMRVLAELAKEFSHDELRISHEQNVILPHVHKSFLPEIYAVLNKHGLATANIGLVSDIIACPGMDYCALATARSIPIAQEISEHFHALGLEHEIGWLKIKISGCINACGHHHVGHIGILGLDRAGVENYQITLGGDGTENAAIAQKVGPGFSAEELVPALGRMIERYLEIRENSHETFLEVYRRLGAEPFKDALYPKSQKETIHAA